jgi:hypothetical protein
MSSSKLGKVPVYRICNSPPTARFPGCVNSYTQVPSEYAYTAAQTRAFRHLNAIRDAYAANIPGCLLLEDCIDVVNSVWNWRFSLDFIWTHANKWQSKKMPIYVVQLYSDNFNHIRKQVETFHHTHQWFAPRTLQDTGGLKCYYIHRTAMQQLITLHSTYSGWNLTSIQNENVEMILYYLPAICIQCPIFTELYKSASRNNFNYIMQQSMPMLFNQNIPPHIPMVPFCAKLYLNGFRDESFQNPADFKLGFLSDLFRNTHIWPYQVVREIEEANILLELPEYSSSVVHVKPWKCAIQCATDQVHNPFADYHINIADACQSDLCIPSVLFSVYKKNAYASMETNRFPFITPDTIPVHFVYVDLDDPPECPKLRMFMEKCIHSGGIHSYGRYHQNYIKNEKVRIQDYRFIICDNSQSDLLVEALMHRCIPVVSSTNRALLYFNKEAFLYGDYLYENSQAGESEYLKKANSPRIPYDHAMFTQYHMANLQIQMNLLLSDQFTGPVKSTIDTKPSTSLEIV